MKNESGFTMIEVAVASVITMSGLVFLATLFTLAITQNRFIKQSTSTTMLAQKKIEELMAAERNDGTNRLAVGGGLTAATQVANYVEGISVDDKTGAVTVTTPTDTSANFIRYWKIQQDPAANALDDTLVISVRVVAVQASRGNTPESTTLTTVRSF